jgi:hypothetical protein
MPAMFADVLKLEGPWRADLMMIELDPFAKNPTEPDDVARGWISLNFTERRPIVGMDQPVSTINLPSPSAARAGVSLCWNHNKSGHLRITGGGRLRFNHRAKRIDPDKAALADFRDSHSASADFFI